MGETIKSPAAFTVNILIKKEDDLYVAHCLELDIVATAPTVKQVQKDIIDLVRAQVDYAFSNDNIDNLFHPAPVSVWNEFFACKHKLEATHKLRPNKTRKDHSHTPPWLTTNTCRLDKVSYA